MATTELVVPRSIPMIFPMIVRPFLLYVAISPISDELCMFN